MEKYGDHDDDRQVRYQGDPEACVGICQYYRSRGLPNPFEENAGIKCNNLKMHETLPKLDFKCFLAGRQQQRQMAHPLTTTTVRNAQLVNPGTVRPTQATRRPRSRRPCVGLCQYYRSRGQKNPMEEYYDYL